MDLVFFCMMEQNAMYFHLMVQGPSECQEHEGCHSLCQASKWRNMTWRNWSWQAGKEKSLQPYLPCPVLLAGVGWRTEHFWGMLCLAAFSSVSGNRLWGAASVTGQHLAVHKHLSHKSWLSCSCFPVTCLGLDLLQAAARWQILCRMKEGGCGCYMLGWRHILTSKT